MKHTILIFLGILVTTFTMAQNEAELNSKPYAAVVNFTSIGTGTPDAAPLTAYITKFKKANKISKISALRIGPLGREGEYKLCFTLKELTLLQHRKFVSGMNNVVKLMTDKGHAGLTTDVKIEKSELPQQATYKAITY